MLLLLSQATWTPVRWKLIELWVELAVARGHIVLMGIIWGQKTWPLYGVEGWPQIRGFLSTILYGDAVGTKVSGRYRQGGRSSGVAVKRGSTVNLVIPNKVEILELKVNVRGLQRWNLSSLHIILHAGVEYYVAWSDFFFIIFVFYVCNFYVQFGLQCSGLCELWRKNIILLVELWVSLYTVLVKKCTVLLLVRLALYAWNSQAPIPIKLGFILEMTLRRITANQRQPFLMHSFRYSS